MIKRTLIVMAYISAIIFIPYYTAELIIYLGAPTLNYKIQEWMVGVAIDCLAVIVLLMLCPILESVIDYIKG